MNYTCPYCRETITVTDQAAIYTGCVSCGREYLTDELPVIYTRTLAARQAREARREIEEVLRDQNRRRQPGGGDDGLAMTWDIPPTDETIVKTEQTRAGLQAPRGRKMERATEFISVRNLPPGMDSEDVRRAIVTKLDRLGM